MDMDLTMHKYLKELVLKRVVERVDQLLEDSFPVGQKSVVVARRRGLP